jgi:hypothetical protein
MEDHHDGKQILFGVRDLSSSACRLLAITKVCRAAGGQLGASEKSLFGTF